MEDLSKTTINSERHSEIRIFLFLTVVLAPLLAVAGVGTYGLVIWLFQMFAGPPTG